MLVGRFDVLSRPRVTAQVRIPGLAFHRELDFLLDTGSGRTALNPDDLGATDLSPLGAQTVVARGYGGLASGHEVPALVQFLEPGVGQRGYQVAALLFTNPDLRGLPSIIGSDIWRHWRMVQDPTAGILEIAIQRSDDFIPAR